MYGYYYKLPIILSPKYAKPVLQNVTISLGSDTFYKF